LKMKRKMEKRKEEKSTRIFVALVAALIFSGGVYADSLALAKDYLPNNTLEISPGQIIDYQLRVQNADSITRQINVTASSSLKGLNVVVSSNSTVLPAKSSILMSLPANQTNNPFTVTISAAGVNIGDEGKVTIGIIGVASASSNGSVVSLKGAVETQIIVKVVDSPLAYAGSNIGLNTQEQPSGASFAGFTGGVSAAFSSISAAGSRAVVYVRAEPLIVALLAGILLVILVAGYTRKKGKAPQAEQAEAKEEQATLKHEAPEQKPTEQPKQIEAPAQKPTSKPRPAPRAELPDFPTLNMVLLLILGLSLFSVGGLAATSGTATASLTIFINATPPETPNNTYPSNNTVVTTTQPNITWTAIAGTNYTLQISAGSAFSTLELNRTGLTTAYYQPNSTEALTKSIHYWRVRAVNGSVDSSWSAWTRFESADPASPGGSAPGTGSYTPSFNTWPTTPAPATPAATTTTTTPTAPAASDSAVSPFSVLDMGTVNLSQLSEIFYNTKVTNFPLYSTTGSEPYKVSNLVNDLSATGHTYTDPMTGQESRVPKYATPIGVGVVSLIILGVAEVAGLALWGSVAVLMLLATLVELGL